MTTKRKRTSSASSKISRSRYSIASSSSVRLGPGGLKKASSVRLGPGGLKKAASLSFGRPSSVRDGRRESDDDCDNDEDQVDDEDEGDYDDDDRPNSWRSKSIDEEDDSDDDEEENEVEEQLNRRFNDPYSEDDDSEDSEAADKDDDQDQANESDQEKRESSLLSVPLGERLQRKEAQEHRRGIDLTVIRQRRQDARRKLQGGSVQPGLGSTSRSRSPHDNSRSGTHDCSQLNNHSNDEHDEKPQEDDDSDGHDEGDPGSQPPPNKKRRSKHAPAEASSRRRDYFRRGPPVLDQSGLGIDFGPARKRYQPCDPRMTTNGPLAIMSAGHPPPPPAEEYVEFLQSMRHQQMAQLKKRIAARQITGRKGHKLRRKLGLTAHQDGDDGDQRHALAQEQAELKQLQQQQADWERRQLEQRAQQTVQKKLQERGGIGDGPGKGPVYHPKRRELKQMTLQAKFEEIRRRGGEAAVQKALAKRRKKNKSKDAGRWGGRERTNTVSES